MTKRTAYLSGGTIVEWYCGKGAWRRRVREFNHYGDKVWFRPTEEWYKTW